MGYKILLADDSVTVQKIITLTFSDEGVDVLTVNNGDEALHRLQYLRPALVMADVSIPGKNGYEICEFVKNHPEMKDTPVVLLVPAFEPFDEERARRIGANQHLTKPFQSIRTLISTVKGLLESNPPRISTPLTNSGALSNTGTLTKRAEQAAQALREAANRESTSRVEASSTVRAYPVQDTQPFPPDMEEEEILPQANSVDDVLGVEAEASQPAFEETSGPLELEIEDVQIPALEAKEILAKVEAVVSTIPEAPVPGETPFVESELELPAKESLPITVAPVVQEAFAAIPNGHRKFTSDLDHVLDLDDVLPEIWPQTISVVPQPESMPSVAATVTEANSVAVSTIPQTVIDEIVNRVVAQLSDKLLDNLVSKLAPEIAELVKHQVQPQTAVPLAPAQLNQDSESLLDLD